MGKSREFAAFGVIFEPERKVRLCLSRRTGVCKQAAAKEELGDSLAFGGFGKSEFENFGIPRRPIVIKGIVSGVGDPENGWRLPGFFGEFVAYESVVVGMRFAVKAGQCDGVGKMGAGIMQKVDAVDDRCVRLDAGKKTPSIAVSANADLFG